MKRIYDNQKMTHEYFKTFYGYIETLLGKNASNVQ